jgi:hypothetical protein
MDDAPEDPVSRDGRHESRNEHGHELDFEKCHAVL